MALAWPQLRSLTFQCPFSTQTTKATVYGLRLFANCAILELLSIPLYATILNPNVGLRPDGNFSTSPLSFLSVGCAPINDPIPVASFLPKFDED